VRKEVDQLWERVLEMTGDPDDQVRYQVLHTLCDGSPRAREEQVIDALRSMRNDKCDKVRRQVRRALVSYDKTGKWNIL
jgi:vesicle coat complex subunit